MRWPKPVENHIKRVVERCGLTASLQRLNLRAGEMTAIRDDIHVAADPDKLCALARLAVGGYDPEHVFAGRGDVAVRRRGHVQGVAFPCEWQADIALIDVEGVGYRPSFACVLRNDLRGAQRRPRQKQPYRRQRAGARPRGRRDRSRRCP